MGKSENEFPVLRALGLYAGDTTGYGKPPSHYLPRLLDQMHEHFPCCL